MAGHYESIAPQYGNRCTVTVESYESICRVNGWEHGPFIERPDGIYEKSEKIAEWVEKSDTIEFQCENCGNIFEKPIERVGTGKLYKSEQDPDGGMIRKIACPECGHDAWEIKYKPCR